MQLSPLSIAQRSGKMNKWNERNEFMKKVDKLNLKLLVFFCI